MTTIITKNGSGAPTAGQLSQGELAVDLTNKELYTKDSGGNVIKVGAQGGSTGTFTDLTATSSFTSPGIDDNATATAITIDTNENVGIGETSPNAKLVIKNDANDEYAIRAGNASGNSGSVVGVTKIGLDTGTSGATHAGAYVGIEQSSASGYQSNMTFATRRTNSDVAPTEAMRIDAVGNVGIGTNEPNDPLHVAATGQDCEVTIQAISAGAFDARLRLNGGSSGFSQINFGSELDSNNGFIQYDNSNKYMAFRANDVERMRIDSSGNVGIGESAPERPLHITSSVPAIRLEDSDIAGLYSEILMASGRTGFRADEANVDSSHYFDFRLGGAERMRIAPTGNIGIGKQNPSEFLHISGASPAVRLDNTGGTTDWLMQNTDNSIRWVSVPSSGGASTERMRIDSTGNVGIGETDPVTALHINQGSVSTAPASLDRQVARLERTGACFLGLLAGDVAQMGIDFGSTTDVDAGSFRFDNNSDSFAWRIADSEKMRIDSSGNLLVGKTSTIAAGVGMVVQPSSGTVKITGATATIPLKIRKETGQPLVVSFTAGGTDAGGINASGGSTPSFAAPSDSRLKDNIVDHESELANVMALRPTRWDWKDEDKGAGEGFIAQELEQTAWSDLVSEGDDGFKQVAGLGTVETRLIKAIQEQQAMIETLQAEVAALKGA